MKGAKFNFDKFLYYKHLETLYTQVLFRLFLISFLTSLWLSQDKENGIEQEFLVHSHLHNLLFSQRLLFPRDNGEEWYVRLLPMYFGICSTIDSSPIGPVLMMIETAFLSSLFIDTRLHFNLSPARWLQMFK